MDLTLGSMISKEDDENKNTEKVIIIGSGPAGLSAALYTARADLNPLVITGMELGGQASLTDAIENYPGFPSGIGGAQLGELFQKQAENFGARLEFDVVTEVDLAQRPFIIKTFSKSYKADTLIIASGASPNHLNVPGETELTGRGVSYCATCDGWFFKGKDILVVGGGDSALEEAIFLTRYANSVTIIHRRDELRAGAILQKRARENPKIHFVWDSVVTEILGEKSVSAGKIKNLKTDETIELKIDGVFVFIGHNPNTQLFQGQLVLNELGFISTDEEMQTSVEGVFAAGEAMDMKYRQVVTSAGMGAAAAIQAIRFLEENK